MVDTENIESQNASITPTPLAEPAKGLLPSAPHGPRPAGPSRSQSAPPAAHKEAPMTAPKTLIQPLKPLKNPPWQKALWNIVTYSWINVLIIFVPVSWAMEFSHQSDTIIFVMSALAVIPLATQLSFATEELALRLGDTLGGLLNCSFGNCVELIISILALIKGEIRVVQAAMIGSILSNTLLVLGCCFFAGGTKYRTQVYRIPVQQLHIGMLGIAVMAIVLPAGFYNAFAELDSNQSEQAQDAEAQRIILEFSHGVAILLLITYIAFLFFQFHTHSYLYRTAPLIGDEEQQAPEGAVFKIPWRSLSFSSHTDSETVSATSETSDHPEPAVHVARAEQQHVAGDNLDEPKLSIVMALGLMLTSTVLAGFTCEWLIGSINGIAEDQNVSKEWLALILLPLLGNAVEHITAVICSFKGRLELALAVAVGSSIQVALLLLPFLVLLGWMISQPLTLYFDLYETIILFISILIVNFAISDGRSHWMEGFLLIMCYILICLTTWYYPSSEGA